MKSVYSLLAATLRTAALSLSRTSAGMPLGATMPRQAPMVQSLPTASLSVGTFGYSADRLASMIARLLTLPASISERASGSEHGAISTPPATMSCRPGAAPLLGTQGTAAGSIFWSRSRPAMARCQMPPCPVPEALNLPGLALIAASRSCTVLYGASARTWMPAGSRLTRPIGVYEAPVSSVRPCQCIMPISTVARPMV